MPYRRRNQAYPCLLETFRNHGVLQAMLMDRGHCVVVVQLEQSGTEAAFRAVDRTRDPVALRRRATSSDARRGGTVPYDEAAAATYLHVTPIIPDVLARFIGSHATSHGAHLRRAEEAKQAYAQAQRLSSNLQDDENTANDFLAE